MHKDFQKTIRSVKTYPDSDIDSDHNPVLMRFTMQRFAKKRSVMPSKIDIRKLKNEVFREKIFGGKNDKAI